MIFIKTYGCTLNKSDSQSMKYYLQDEITDSLDDADIIIFNTCGVKGQTEHKVLKDIAPYVGKKKVIVAGCLPLIHYGAIPENVEAIIGPDQIPKIASIVDSVRQGNKVREIKQASCMPMPLPQVRDGVVAIVPVSLGCMGSCTYCATRFARGKLRSYALEDISREVSMLVKEGYKEFQLTSQDTGCYGIDIGTSLPELLATLAEISKDIRIRVGMMNPNHALMQLDELLEAFDAPNIYKFLHLPIQSGSNTVLRDMNRKYNVEEYMFVVDAFRDRFAGLYLATDVIVGFPRETEEDFERSLDIMYRSFPDKVNITRYSARPGTISSKFPQFPDRIKKDRSRILSKIVHKHSLEINKRYIGKQFDALIVEKGKRGRCVGRLNNYKPVICDGKIGLFTKVMIKDATSTYLIA
ncbi:MAG: tRNA (N(6)-L-threonylcarbamoyladenosine(37)-C(2))-methylthiotransferase [Candidatus Methanofastidiosia archaeon]